MPADQLTQSTASPAVCALFRALSTCNLGIQIVQLTECGLLITCLEPLFTHSHLFITSMLILAGMPGLPEKPSSKAGSGSNDLQFNISLRDFYSLAVTQAGNAARSYSSTLDARRTGGVDVETAVRLDVYQTDKETVEALRAFFLGLVSAHPNEEPVTLRFMHATLDALELLHASTTAEDALKAYQELLAAKAAATAAIKPTSTTSAEKPTEDDGQGSVSPFVVTAVGVKVVLSITGSSGTVRDTTAITTNSNVVDTALPYAGRAEAAAADSALTARFYAHVMALLDGLRNSSLCGNGTGPTPAELIAIGLASQFIREGHQLPRLFTPLSPPGWSPSYQSFVFVTDAGADHIKITVQDPELLARGIVVHVEHIDRR